MASFKSVFLLLVILAAGGTLLAAGEKTTPAGDDDGNGMLPPTVMTNNDTFELEMVCLYQHWLKHHGERTNYTLIQFELDPRFLLFKSYFQHVPVVPTLESRCLSRKDNSTASDPSKDNGSGDDDQHNNSTASDPSRDNGSDRDDQHHNNSTITDPPKDNGTSRDDLHNDDNDDKVDHQNANVVNNCDDHGDGGDNDQQSKKKKSLRDEVLNALSVAMMIVGIITTAVLTAFCILRGFITVWTCLSRRCGRGEESMSV